MKTNQMRKAEAASSELAGAREVDTTTGFGRDSKAGRGWESFTEFKGKSPGVP